MNQSEGSGWNMALGTIIRPIPALRLGAAIKSPTYYKTSLEYADYLYALMGTAKDGKKFSSSVDYKYTSPWSLDLSAGLTFGIGDVSCALGAEYERHFTQRSSLFISNTKLENQGSVDYKDYSVIKAGTELNIKNLSLRGGYNYRESMFNDDSYPYLYDSDFNGWGYDDNGDLVVGRTDFQIDRSGKTQYFTGGIGYCSAPDRDGTQFYIDLAYVHGIKNSVFNLNEYDEDINVDYKYKTDKVQLTIGWNF
jgi:long-subunit fatty acid transport protein